MNVDLQKFERVTLETTPNREWIGLHFEEGGEAISLRRGMPPRAVALELLHVAARLQRRDASTSKDALRKLRMWHWNEVLDASAQRAMYDKAREPWAYKEHDERWALHVGAVQCLNDLLPDTTAEQDCKQEMKK